MIVRDLRGRHKPAPHPLCELWAQPRPKHIPIATSPGVAALDAEIDRMHIRHPVAQVLRRVDAASAAPAPPAPPAAPSTEGER